MSVMCILFCRFTWNRTPCWPWSAGTVTLTSCAKSKSKLYILCTVHCDTHTWERPTRWKLFWIVYFTSIILDMFRTSNCSSSTGVLYKQLTVFHHAFMSSLVADTIGIILEWSFQTRHRIYKSNCHYVLFSTAPQHSIQCQPRYSQCDNFCTIHLFIIYQIIIGTRVVAKHNKFY